MMTSTSDHHSFSGAPWRRLLGFVLLSLLLHGALFGWFGGPINWHLSQQESHSISARLAPLPAAAPPAASAAAAAPTASPATTPVKTPKMPKPHRKASTDTPAAKPASDAAVMALVPTPAATTETFPAVNEPVGEEIVGLMEAAMAEKRAAQEAGAGNLPVYQVNPPPPGQLKYHVKRVKEGNTTEGSAKFDWQHDGKQYRLHGETSILFFTLLTVHSEGEFDQAGLAPLRYSEKPIRRSETNTHFNRIKPDLPAHPTNGDTISFSASSAVLPRPPGAQDRVSVLWQLAGIGRAMPQQFVAGNSLQIMVAGVRDAEVWQISILGQEELLIDGKPHRSWHLQREPRSGTYEKKMDIWLAPEKDWLAVRVRSTEASGEILELSLNGLGAALDAKDSPGNYSRTAEP